MAGLSFTLTDVGRAALVNAQNTGVNALTISQIGVSAVHTAGEFAGLTALPNELKRLNTFGGDVVADDTLHLTIRDESADSYSLRAFGLYLSNGVLFGVYSQAAVILEKSQAAMLLLATDVVLASLTTAMIEFGSTDFINPPATSDTPGVVELADQPEVDAGVRNDVAVTPGRLRALLVSLLGTKADVGHSHDAGAVTSGVFSILRIPDLTMAKIAGLTAALAGKADSGHTHAAGDVVSGVFSVLRIPDLAMAKITGLADALATKAAAFHTHAMADITGLAAALAGKSDTGHTHDATAVTSGTLAIGRIPDLGIAKITGLIDALAGKAATAHSHAMADITGLVAALSLKLNGADFTWANLTGKPDVAVKNTNTLFSSVQLVEDANAIRGRIYFGDQSGGSRQLVYTGGVYDFTGADLQANGSRVWTLATFDPASKASVSHTHTATQVTDLLDTVWPAGELKMFDQATPPTGVRVLVANGATVSRTTYDRLFAAIGTRYGAGDGAATFQLPDWRGLFFRGLDNGRGLDPARALGVFQDSANKAHDHGYNYPAGNDQGGSGADPNYTFTSEALVTGSSGGPEARPVNQALLACITY